MIIRSLNTSPPAPPASKPAPPQDPQGIGDCVEKAVRWVAGKVVGLAFGTSGLAVNAAAGGAEGIIRGARLSSHTTPVFYGAMTVNLAAIGALSGGPVGAVTGVIGGHLLWRIEGEEVRKRVAERADAWVDKTLAKLPGDPDQAGVLRRVANGAVGEVVGAAAGAVAGTIGLYQKGEQVGEDFVDRVSARLRGR
ncbi:MAG: hypothetical protein FJX76_11640 [Armatimonadetes bacterium]|nr:hypothetical protein [Armatimonadota bacterium]